MLSQHEVPVAYSMVVLARQIASVSPQPFSEYTCYWTAFNNIYVTLAAHEGQRTSLTKNLDGSLRTKQVAHITLPVPKPITEQKQIDLAFAQFGEDLKHRIVKHPSTRFFVYRTPCWHGQAIQHDVWGQRLNGVLNIGYTVNKDNPYWTPINTQVYEQYVQGETDLERTNELAKQLLQVLYTVRNNIFHGGKRADDANDIEVIEKAFPLLKMVVNNFLQSNTLV